MWGWGEGEGEAQQVVPGEAVIRGLVYLAGFGVAAALGVWVMPVLFLVVGVSVIVWWDLTKGERV